jgi:glutathione peroxidase
MADDITLDTFEATAIDGSPRPLSTDAGRVRLVVNTASQCGLTPQYEGLQALSDTYADAGLTVLGFPCDQFGNQEPGTDGEIATFCTSSYGVTFPMYAKVEVNGPSAHPVFGWLQAELPGESGGPLQWNFTKFLVDRGGRPVARFEPQTTPEEIAPAIAELLAKE